MRDPAPRPAAGHPPRILVSVRDADEADIAVRAGADLVDAKDPKRGALGALIWKCRLAPGESPAGVGRA